LSKDRLSSLPLSEQLEVLEKRAAEARGKVRAKQTECKVWVGAVMLSRMRSDEQFRTWALRALGEAVSSGKSDRARARNLRVLEFVRAECAAGAPATGAEG